MGAAVAGPFAVAQAELDAIDHARAAHRAPVPRPEYGALTSADRVSTSSEGFRAGSADRRPAVYFRHRAVRAPARVSGGHWFRHGRGWTGDFHDGRIDTTSHGASVSLRSHLVLALAGTAGAQTVKETSNETRFQFDFKVPDAALAALLPQGFTSDVQRRARQGLQPAHRLHRPRDDQRAGRQAARDRHEPARLSGGAGQGSRRPERAARRRRA